MVAMTETVRTIQLGQYFKLTADQDDGQRKESVREARKLQIPTGLDSGNLFFTRIFCLLSVPLSFHASNNKVNVRYILFAIPFRF
jgi:hypothetical protein